MGINLLLNSLVLCPSPSPGRKGEPPVPQSRLPCHSWVYFPERNPYSNCRVPGFAFNNEHVLQRQFHRWNPSKSNLMFPITLHIQLPLFLRTKPKSVPGMKCAKQKKAQTQNQKLLAVLPPRNNIRLQSEFHNIFGYTDTCFEKNRIMVELLYSPLLQLIYK